MLDKVATYSFLIDAYLSDFRGKATLPMIGGFMLSSATRHADERGFGYTAMTALARAWVLSKMTIEIVDYPQNGTILYVKTWVSDVNRLFTERCFSFFNEEGKNIGYARSIWVAIDLETRRPTNVQELEGLVDYIDGYESCPIGAMKKILLLKDTPSLMTYDIKYSDIDINGHLNSMKYIEHFVDLFDLNIFKQKQIRRFEINYFIEGKYGSTIDLFKKDDNDISILEMRDGTSVLSNSRITWQ